ncbi:MAG: PspA-associated protein PspAB [Nocardioides sp.]
MKIWDVLTGRSSVPPADLDRLFLVPSAAITLQTAAGFEPTGTGSVCFRAPSGRAAQQVQDEAVSILGVGDQAPTVEVEHDSFGYTWVVVQGEGDDMAGLCTGLHGVNTLLEEQGFGAGLLCTLVGFHDSGGRSFGLVYLYKQSTFYPFAPSGTDTRDNLLEMSVRDELAGDLPMEEDLQQWLALWGAPGL